MSATRTWPPKWKTPIQARLNRNAGGRLAGPPSCFSPGSMAVRLPNSIFIHLMKTGGWTVISALDHAKLHRGTIGRDHDPACLLPLPTHPRPFVFVFVRHPLTWYRSYWAYRMQAAWQVHPEQPITGWQTFGSVLDHECRSD